MKIECIALTIILTMAACASSETKDSKTRNVSNAQNGDELWNPWGCCELISERHLGWTEVGPFGLSPEQAFSKFEGSCRAPFRWGQSQNNCSDQLAILPEISKGFVEVEVKVDQQSAVLIESESQQGVDCGCQGLIQIPSTLTFRTSDGLFDEERQVTLVQTESNTNSIIGWSVTADESNGAIHAQSKVAGAEVSLGVTVFPVQEDCAGYIGVSMNQEKDDIGESWTCGYQAIWSNKGCEANVLGLQGTQSDLEKPFDRMVKKIADLWKEASYDGEWDDQTTTRFQLAVEPLAQSACINYHDADGSYDFLIPVQVTANTSDGRITNVTGVGNVLSLVQKDWNISRLDLWMSEDAECESHYDLSSQSLSYSQIDHVTTSFSIEHDFDNISNNTGNAEIRVFTKASDGKSREITLKADLASTI